ncbi:MAG: hypothetical protein GX487_07550 [Acetomicrobium flavidum]|uniref:Tetratricopeptide repeat protein n=3 Tax=Acetomicrobium TaxID=49894 RepID=I4BYC7_ACEMN|nr:hypothetical protein [Acetomicrobium mobile]NLG95196.1 hypothetical protein [Acetomicrobium flavidum]AFM22284.1 hypothetical protein Anamo_1690 [Acetomicrobium mobile DSM 13181]SIN72082.1 hypothetical protein SAMN05444368_1492 [Acetomicrobium flavidum]HOM30999.1 hypothetical protein [Acetomicrobium flavidum]HOP87711.1 hypothetical protein [Acetomicrobium flavidum]
MSKEKHDRNDEVKLLLDMASATEDDVEAEKLAREILEIDPSNMEAKLILADVAISNGDMETNRKYLGQIITECETKYGDVHKDSPVSDIYVSALERMAFSLSFDDRHEEALSVAQKLLEIDTEEQTAAKDIIYRSLLMLDRYREVLEMICSERTHTPVALHAKAIALYSLDGISSNSYEALIDAIEADPDAPFYALGIWEEPEEPDESEIDSMLTALYIVEPWSKSDKLIDWLSHMTIVFGFLTERLSDEFLDYLESSEDGPQIQEKLNEAKATLNKLIKLKMANDEDLSDMDKVVFESFRM